MLRGFEPEPVQVCIKWIALCDYDTIYLYFHYFPLYFTFVEPGFSLLQSLPFGSRAICVSLPWIRGLRWTLKGNFFIPSPYTSSDPTHKHSSFWYKKKKELLRSLYLESVFCTLCNWVTRVNIVRCWGGRNWTPALILSDTCSFYHYCQRGKVIGVQWYSVWGVDILICAGLEWKIRKIHDFSRIFPRTGNFRENVLINEGEKTVGVFFRK